MVDDANRLYPDLGISIEEAFIAAKTGNPQDCEDMLQMLPIPVVIDGATAKIEKKWDGRTGGQICASLIWQILGDKANLNASARQVVDRITQLVHDFYVEHNIIEIVQAAPEYRLTASFIAYNIQRREIWLVGDCQGLLDEQLITNTKEVDSILSATRSFFLASELALGKTVEELREQDSGREFILPLLKRQMLFQNNPGAGAYWYPVIDGFPVPDEGIRVIPVPEGTRTIVLSSDGYPVLKPTLAESEQVLEEILRADPLLFRTYQSTKGLIAGHSSFDDRAYLRLHLRGSDEQDGA